MAYIITLNEPKHWGSEPATAFSAVRWRPYSGWVIQGHSATYGGMGRFVAFRPAGGLYRTRYGVRKAGFRTKREAIATFERETGLKVAP